MLQTTGYRVTSIMPQENTVLLAKDGLTYKLSLDRNSANAAQRRESQNTYAAAVRERSTAILRSVIVTSSSTKSDTRTIVNCSPL